MKNYGLGNLNEQLKLFEAIKHQGLQSVQQLKQFLNHPEYNKPEKTFKLVEVSRLLDIPRTTLRNKEKESTFSYCHQPNETKAHYSLRDINEIRDYFNKGFYAGSLHRPSNIEPVVMAFSMFKGGVGKTTHACHLAAHCALMGLKTLLIDLDPQASATFMYGYVPSVDLRAGETIRDTLVEDLTSIHKVIKPTHYGGLDIITSGLELQGADIVLPNHHYNEIDNLGSPLLRLTKALRQLKQYDMVILDCAPNHAAVTLNALTAANGIIIPVSPNMLSYGSSIHFIETLSELSSTLLSYRNQLAAETPEHPDLQSIQNHDNKMFRILITNDPTDSESQDVTAAIRALYGDFVLPRPMSRTIALTRTSNDICLLYDQKRGDVRGSKESFDRGLAAMKAVNEDILTVMAASLGVQND